MCWTELTGIYLDTFDYGQGMGMVAPEIMVADGDGEYLKYIIPQLREWADGDVDKYRHLLDLFWAGWYTVNHHWDEDDYTH